MDKENKNASYMPAPWEPADAKAIQKLAEGTADEHQQKRALAWIINNACATYDLPFRPGGVDGARQTDLAIGRAFVGQQIVKMIKIDLVAIEQAKNTNRKRS